MQKLDHGVTHYSMETMRYFTTNKHVIIHNPLILLFRESHDLKQKYFDHCIGCHVYMYQYVSVYIYIGLHPRVDCITAVRRTYTIPKWGRDPFRERKSARWTRIRSASCTSAGRSRSCSDTPVCRVPPWLSRRPCSGRVCYWWSWRR